MKRNFCILIAVAVLVGWRGMWLASAVPDTTAWADTAAELAQQQLDRQHPRLETFSEQWRISFAAWEQNALAARFPFALQASGQDLWDKTLPIWITPGRDGQPGWAGWDDNGDGVIDDDGELGAAWSDDFCVVQLPGEPPPLGRIIDHGAFRPLEHLPPPGAILRQRFDVVERPK